MDDSEARFENCYVSEKLRRYFHSLSFDVKEKSQNEKKENRASYRDRKAILCLCEERFAVLVFEEPEGAIPLESGTVKRQVYTAGVCCC